MADLFDLQDEIAQAIASALEVQLSRTPTPFELYKPSLPAYEALLKARHYFAHFSVDSLARMKEYYEQAITLDPKFALAHCEFGHYFVTTAILGTMPASQAMPMVRSLAQRALELDPSFPEGHAMLGLVAGVFEYDWKEAERRFRLAMAGDRVPSLVRWLYAVHHLLPTGRPDEAGQQLDLALQEDPLNMIMQLNRAICFIAAGREENARRAFREILEFNPNIGAAYGYLALLHLGRGELDQAAPLIERGYSITPMVPNAIGAMAGILKRMGETSRSEELLRKLLPGDVFGAPRGLATYNRVLGELDEEADWIEKAMDQRDPAAPTLAWSNRELRSIPRWAGLMRKLNLPEA